MNQAAVSVKQRQRPDLLFLTTFCPGGPPEKPCCGLLFLTTILTTKYPAKAGSITQYLAVSDKRRQQKIHETSTLHRHSVDIFWCEGGDLNPLISPDSTLIFSKLLLNHYFALFLPNIYREAPCTSNPLPHEAADRFFSWS